ncbi:MAG: aminodeoxychorismate synthase component I [Alcanivoracaceae bacterium]|nr:aminodeoxychorismate synthase component I [Alcanivoracaceae bacterium]|tara:strand:- start:1114 stop:2229 length:1116 start_codon:yes stop_codon:yes gene_type:complete
MITRCLYRSGDQLLALPQPDLTLIASNERDMQACMAQVNRELGTQYRFVCGLLPYESGHWRHNHQASPLPVTLYLYKEAPRLLAESEVARQDFRLQAAFKPDQPKSDYLQALSKIRHYLEAGDCYQVNLAQRFSAPFSGSPLSAWLALDAAHPAPHSCYFDTGDQQIFGVSPERFLSIRQGKVVSEPIKGSRPRGATPEEDHALAQELQANPKDRAENLMIVDLLRNDLGACCKPGSVSASPLFELRQFSNVQHLVSTVHGELLDGLSPLEALWQAFPGGSITGAPKKRAMEIIHELEPFERGAYCGSFFWMDDQGNLDSNILIRTLQTNGDRLYCHGGGGIVFDSEPQAEYEESYFKVAKLMGALEEAFL